MASPTAAASRRSSATGVAPIASIAAAFCSDRDDATTSWPRPTSLDGVELHNNWKLRQRDHYLAAIERIQSHGVTVNGCFILGLDGDTLGVFDEVLEFVRESGLYEVQVTFLTPFPGTPLYRRLKQEGRLIRENAWELCTLFDINLQPKNMSVDELQSGFLGLAKQLYSAAETAERRRGFRNRLKTSPHFGRRADTPILQAT